MARCKMCEGTGFVRDPKSANGYAYDEQNNGILCPPSNQGGCGGSGEAPAQPELTAQP